VDKTFVSFIPASAIPIARRALTLDLPLAGKSSKSPWSTHTPLAGIVQGTPLACAGPFGGVAAAVAPPPTDVAPDTATKPVPRARSKQRQSRNRGFARRTSPFLQSAATTHNLTTTPRISTAPCSWNQISGVGGSSTLSAFGVT